MNLKKEVHIWVTYKQHYNIPLKSDVYAVFKTYSAMLRFTVGSFEL